MHNLFAYLFIVCCLFYLSTFGSVGAAHVYIDMEVIHQVVGT